MSGTHDILAAERAAAEANKQSSQGIWQGQAGGQTSQEAPIITDIVVDKEASSGLDPDRINARDTLSGATSSSVHAGLGHPGSGQSSKELHHNGRPGRKRETQIHYQGSKPDELKM
ncbi:hypothetical protein C0992_003600 [Termitomyces sp. T32_za158]|nr:hypothetical protein C0992_003600 [Termitomyces sp. T32_za158]